MAIPIVAGFPPAPAAPTQTGLPILRLLAVILILSGLGLTIAMQRRFKRHRRQRPKAYGF